MNGNIPRRRCFGCFRWQQLAHVAVEKVYAAADAACRNIRATYDAINASIKSSAFL